MESYLANREILGFSRLVSAVCCDVLRPERLPSRIKECSPHTLIQRTTIQRNLNSIRDTLSQSLDIKVLIFRNLKDKRRRFEPTTVLHINISTSLKVPLSSEQPNQRKWSANLKNKRILRHYYQFWGIQGWYSR